MNKFKKLFNDTPIPIVEFKLNTEKIPIIISVNKAFMNKFTIKNNKKELVGKSLNKLIVPDEKINESRKFDEKTLNGIKNCEIIERKTPKGIKKFAYRSISYNDKKGFAFYTDITDNIQKTEHIDVLNRILRHNLRNELNIIMGLNTIINKETNNTDIQNYCSKLNNSTSRLKRLTEEAKIIKNITKENTKLNVLNLKTQIKYAIDMCSNNLDISCINLDISSDTTIKSGEKIHFVFESLIDNAIRYNNSNTPYVKIFAKEYNEYVDICIEDNGPGIPKEEIHIINQDEKISELKHGSGLGLWLSKWIIETYNGKLIVDNNMCGGTTIKIRLINYQL